MKKIKRLNQFLESEGVLQEFYDNLSFDKDWIGVGPDRLMTTTFSFDWARTKQGGEFWLEIGDKYKAFLEEKPKRWTPETNGQYYFVEIDTCNIDGFGVAWWVNDSIDNERLNNHSLFKTEEQAKEAYKRIKKCLKKYQKSLNHGT